MNSLRNKTLLFYLLALFFSFIFTSIFIIESHSNPSYWKRGSIIHSYEPNAKLPVYVVYINKVIHFLMFSVMTSPDLKCFINDHLKWLIKQYEVFKYRCVCGALADKHIVNDEGARTHSQLHKDLSTSRSTQDSSKYPFSQDTFSPLTSSLRSAHIRSLILDFSARSEGARSYFHHN